MSDQDIRRDEIRERGRQATAASRRRHGNYAERVRERAIELSARWVRENQPDVWLACMRDARAHIDQKRRER